MNQNGVTSLLLYKSCDKISNCNTVYFCTLSVQNTGKSGFEPIRARLSSEPCFLLSLQGLT